ncbi:MAG: carboxylesterase family protein, partial [Halioglobus sp.]|nr:carboxylesterase family protein [Halioglobus sp.]
MKCIFPIIGLALVAACSGGVEIGAAPEPLPVKTSSGDVTAEMKGQVLFWRDIPYAQPPVGGLRWRATRPMEAPLENIPRRDKVACFQIASDVGGVDGEGVVGSEDCLYLDIMAPAQATSAAPLPVMFWIHGGGNTSGYKGYYDFSTLVESQQVVVVTINYRLGPFGWFTHPVVHGGAKGQDRSSNFGTLDIIQGLKWVQQNIDAFGGNPDNVTIFGESAGGHNVFALLASPLSEGLFHKAISQSGYISTNTVAEAINSGGEYPRVRRSSSQLFASALEAGVISDVSAQSAYGVSGKTLMEHYLALDGQGDIPLTT